MKNFIVVLSGIVALLTAASGCVSISKYTPPEDEKPIVKIGTTGSQQPKVKVDVELLERPDLSRFKAPKTPDNDLYGNRGNLESGVLLRRQNFQAPDRQKSENEPKVWWPGNLEETAPQAAETGPAYQIVKYKVRKGQTLADISRQFYGTTKKWKEIYEANKDKLKNPDKIYAGQLLNIPVESEENAVKRLK